MILLCQLAPLSTFFLAAAAGGGHSDDDDEEEDDSVPGVEHLRCTVMTTTKTKIRRSRVFFE